MVWYLRPCHSDKSLLVTIESRTKQQCKTHDIDTLLTMPSKKKKKGQRKKAKADKKDRGEDKEAVTVAAVDSQMQRL
jgi:hypothetical protein